jgi:hypothetical protein
LPPHPDRWRHLVGPCALASAAPSAGLALGCSAKGSRGQASRLSTQPRQGRSGRGQGDRGAPQTASPRRWRASAGGAAGTSKHPDRMPRRPLRRSGPPQQGQPCRGCSKKRSTCSGGKRARSCLGCPGWPPRRRWSCPAGGGGGGGLTRSEEGGLEEVEESWRAAATWPSSRATVACNCSRGARCCSRCAGKRWHPAQGVVTASARPSFSSQPALAARCLRERLPADIPQVLRHGDVGRESAWA